MQKEKRYNPVLKEDLVPVNIEKLLKEKGYNSEEVHDLLGKDVLFFSTELKGISGENDQELLTPETVEVKKNPCK
jgi:hypothetical protein